MGHPCTATVGCARGLTCILGTCHPFCDEPGGSCTGSDVGACVQIHGPGGTPIPSYAVCRVKCALHVAASCGGETNAGIGACLVDGAGGTDCQEGGTRKEKETCAAADPCAPGLACVGPASGTKVCRRWCRVGTSDCGGSTQCTAFSTKVMADGVEYGVCP